MASKAELIEQAVAMGLSTKGSKAQLEKRIAEAQQAEERPEYVPEENGAEEVEPIEGPIEEPIEEPQEPVSATPVYPVPEEKPKRAVAAAFPVSQGEGVESRIATRTTVKFIGRWYTLRQGQKFTAPASVIKALEDAGFLEKG